MVRPVCANTPPVRHSCCNTAQKNTKENQTTHNTNPETGPGGAELNRGDRRQYGRFLQVPHPPLLPCSKLTLTSDPHCFLTRSGFWSDSLNVVDPMSKSVSPERFSVSLGALGRLRLALNVVKLYRKNAAVASDGRFQNKSFRTTTSVSIFK